MQDNSQDNLQDKSYRSKMGDWQGQPFWGKYISLPDLASKVEKLKGEGKTIVLTNGCFDLLHVGHIRSLRHAKALGDVLVVAVNSDQSVRRYKGEHLPLVSEKERLEVLSSLEMIDFLLLFDEPSVEVILRTLKPHFHAKGRDYGEKTVPEREVVLSYGGKIAIVGDPKDHSTSGMIEKITKLTK